MNKLKLIPEKISQKSYIPGSYPKSKPTNKYAPRYRIYNILSPISKDKNILSPINKDKNIDSSLISNNLKLTLIPIKK